MSEPVATRAQILELLEKGPEEGMRAAEVTRELGLTRGQRPRVRQLLRELVRSEAVAQYGRRFRLRSDPSGTPCAGDESAEPARVPGVYGALRVTPQGRGIVVLDDVAQEPVLVKADDLGAAIDGDRVEIRVVGGRRRPIGEVARIIERGRKRVSGVLQGPPWTVHSDDPRLPQPIEVMAPVSDSEVAAPGQVGQIVLAEIVRYPEAPGEPIKVTVERQLGQPGVLASEVTRLLYEQDIAEGFPDEVLRSAAETPDHVRAADHVDRVDLRDRSFITIDPETARDFDDAVTVEPGPKDTSRVWVAVADVSHYVHEGTPVDQEARARGCSAYLPDRAIHMLPERLSSGICSLVPNRDRLTMVVRLDIDERGRVLDAECVAAVIHSRGRLDYGGVAAAFAGQLRGRWARYEEHLAQLQRLQQITRALRGRRLRRGSLDLDLVEPKVVLDEDDPLRVRDIVVNRQVPTIREAYGLIEELMLAANEAVGRIFEAANRATVWRVHETPKEDSLLQLTEWLSSYGINVGLDGLRTPKAMSRLLQQLRGHPAARPLSYLVLRSLKQATYRTVNRGHFGLASSSYLHFTSPIRRYPDLVVHRLMKRLLRAEGRPAGGRQQSSTSSPPRDVLSQVAERASLRERRALEVSRQVHSIYAARLMRDRIGDELPGSVSGLTSFGMFVTLDEPYVDGMVRIESLPEPMRFDGRRQRLFGRRTGTTISLGDRVRVKVVGASVARRQIDLELVQHRGSDVAAKGGLSRRRGSRIRGSASHDKEGRRHRRSRRKHSL